MNLLDELRSLDPQDPGRWPLPIRIGAVVAWFAVLTLVLSYFVVWKQKEPELARAESEEMSLRSEFTAKHSKAVNLEIYKSQLKDIERSFGALLRQLPGKTEVPNLLVDISQTGLAAGLQEKLFQPGDERKQDFYAEKPIKLRLTGSYHEFGEFVSGIAALPRIVTLHNIEIKPASTNAKDAQPDELTLDLTAKTYRYLDEEEIATGEAEKRTTVRRPGNNKPGNK
jgi:type IV pilus assembly protein PilO